MANETVPAAGVIGWPVSHSLSPKLHNYWLSHYGLKGSYQAVAIEPEQLEDKIEKLIESNWRGFNVTLPHKEAMIALMDEMEDRAARIGAVNTVVIKDAKCIGHNTDIYGFWENIKPHVKQKNRAVVVGAGGAARAVIDALVCNGYKDIIVVNRTMERAKELQKTWQSIRVEDWKYRNELLKNADILINTTSLGMREKAPLDIDLAHLPVSALVNDLVYTPLLTPLLSAAKNRGNSTVDGLGMLFHQAVPAFEAWFGIKPAVTPELRAHIMEAA